MNRRERLHRCDLLDEYRRLFRYLLDLKRGAVMVADRRALAVIINHVEREIAALSAILSGTSRHVLPPFPNGAQSHQNRGVATP
jgi:hypothetical protein